MRTALVVLAAALLGGFAFSLQQRSLTEQCFVHTTYYLLLIAVSCWAGTYLHAARDLRRNALVAWVAENWPGVVVALSVTVIAWLAVDPALRVLSDEANLVGTSKNLFASKTATFTVSGKNYYGSYWDVDVAIDRRPVLFPFFVSLVHAVRGYSYENVFTLNLLLLPAFLLVAYRLAKSLAGETFAVTGSLLVAAHPIVLMSVRSGGFDFFATFFALLVIKSLLDYCREQSPAKLAILWLNLCLFAEIRYESALFMPPVVALLLAFRMIDWSTLRPYAFVYALTPVYLAPRVWQSILRGNVPEQDAGTVTFSVDNFIANAYEYFEPLFEPSGTYPAHSALVIAAGVIGCVQWLTWIRARAREKNWSRPELRFGVFVTAWMLLQAILVFTYYWGRAQYPSAARLVLVLDVFFSLAAAWTLTRALARFRPFVVLLVAGALLILHVPVASQQRMFNRLTQTRESAATWRFFEQLNEKRILVVTDRPGHFTIMGYGAMSFESARRDAHLLTAFSRRLFHDLYVIQQVELATNQPRPGYDFWPDRKFEPVLEFQNDANVLVRVSRLTR